MSIVARKLVAGEEAMLDTFLAATPASTVFLRSNLARAGLTDDGAPFSGTYVGVFEDEVLVAAAVSSWNTNVVVAPGPHAALAARTAVELSGRRVGGILGPHAEMLRTREALGLTDAATTLSTREILYTLPTRDLRLPAPVADGTLIVRAPREEELAPLLDWRMDYCAETSNMPDTPEIREAQARTLASYQERGHHFVATVEEERVAYSSFNATVADVVQIGGVWTPKALRSRGHARSVVAGSLQTARDRGVRTAVLFTPDTNVAAQRAYASLGFQRVGSYGIVLFVV